MAWRVGVDSGGTFTDVCLFEETTGRVEVWKVASTPDDPSRGIAEGVRKGRAGRGRATEVGYFGHGTTVATNALIQHRGVKTGLITTDGFRDLLEIGRQKRPDLYDLQADKPPVLVSRDLRLEVPERVRHDGTVETPARRRGGARRRRAACARLGSRRWRSASSTASSAPSTRRRRAASSPRSSPRPLSASRTRWRPSSASIERMSTAVVNAYLGPVMQGYITRLAERLAGLGLSRDAAPDAVQRRRHRVRGGRAAAGPHCAVRPDPPAWSRAQEVGRMAGFARPDHLRHGRHQHRRRIAAGRAVPAGQRGRRARLSDQGADARHPHRGRRRRLDRLCRQRRPAEGRAAQRRRRSGSGLLRPGQRGADGHRRQCRAADAEPDASAGRAHGRSGRTSRKAAIERLADDAWHGRDGDRAGHPLRGHRQHGARDPGDQRAARARSARLHAGGVRRRRTAACGAAGARAGHQPHPRAAHARHPLRDGAAADRSAGRLRHHAAAYSDAGGRSPEHRQPPSTRCTSRRSTGSRRRDRARVPGGITRTVDMRYAGQNYELAVPLPDGPIGAGDARRAGRGLRRRAPAHVRLRRRGRADAARDLPRRGDRRGAQGRVPAAARCRARCVAAHRRPARGLAAGGRRLRVLPDLRPRRAATPATASSGRRSSSRWTRRPSSCPA